MTNAQMIVLALKKKIDTMDGKYKAINRLSDNCLKQTFTQIQSMFIASGNIYNEITKYRKAMEVVIGVDNGTIWTDKYINIAVTEAHSNSVNALALAEVNYMNMKNKIDVYARHNISFSSQELNIDDAKLAFETAKAENTQWVRVLQYSRKTFPFFEDELTS